MLTNRLIFFHAAVQSSMARPIHWSSQKSANVVLVCSIIGLEGVIL